MRGRQLSCKTPLVARSEERCLHLPVLRSIEERVVLIKKKLTFVVPALCKIKGLVLKTPASQSFCTDQST